MYYVEKLILNIIEEKEEAKSMSGTYPNDSLIIVVSFNEHRLYFLERGMT
jgi:hypothetical protein